MKVKILYLVPVTIFASFTALANQPAKVTAVIPVKFKVKGNHAPVPYSQALMQKGWVKVPTINTPYTGGSGKFNPTSITKKSLATAMTKAAKNAGSMNPLIKAAMLAYGAYEIGCEAGLCIENPNGSDLTPSPSGGVAPDYGPYTVCWAFSSTMSTYGPGYPTLAIDGHVGSAQCRIKVTNAYRDDIISLMNKNRPCKYKVVDVRDGAFSLQEYVMNNAAECVPYDNPRFYSGWGELKSHETGEKCPPKPSPHDPDLYAGYVNGPYTATDGTKYCYKGKPSKAGMPVPADWLENKIGENPAPIGDIGLDDFVDWSTGAPIPDLFDKPTVEDVSPAFRDAAEGSARGTSQSNNPSAPHYIPPDKVQDFYRELEKWYNGEPFQDVFTGKPVEPTKPAPEPTKTDWTDFPGITQGQYEESNNKWGNDAANKAPDIKNDINAVEKSFDELKDIIKDEPKEVPFELNPFKLINFPHGGCKGFSIDASIRGEPKTILVNQHCPPYDAWGRPIVEWILGVFTLLHIFNIARRALEVE